MNILLSNRVKRNSRWTIQPQWTGIIIARSQFASDMELDGYVSNMGELFVQRNARSFYTISEVNIMRKHTDQPPNEISWKKIVGLHGSV